jgi:hypothetical protein
VEKKGEIAAPNFSKVKSGLYFGNFSAKNAHKMKKLIISTVLTLTLFSLASAKALAEDTEDTPTPTP